MKLETRTFDLYAKVLAIAFATMIRLCNCVPFQLLQAKKLDLKAKVAAIATCTVLLLKLCLAVSTPSFFSNMEIGHWLEK